MALCGAVSWLDQRVSCGLRLGELPENVRSQAAACSGGWQVPVVLEQCQTGRTSYHAKTFPSAFLARGVHFFPRGTSQAISRLSHKADGLGVAKQWETRHGPPQKP